MSSQPLIQFSDIEDYKENIEPLKEGRSAQSLVKAFSTQSSEKDIEREKLEQQILESNDLDDPIEPYLDYIKWINQTYPQGNNNNSGLVQLLERCTSQFRDASFYKDDSRYLKVWMQYAKYSDAPKELFTYLARKEIGKNLSLFYEEYATYLEVNNCKNQANEVYQIGISLQARPFERLKRRYQEFCERLSTNPPSSNEPNSPVLPVVRQALAFKGGLSTTSSTSEPLPESSNIITKKLQVFTDPSGTHPGNPSTSSSWDSIGTLASRRKENTVQATSWAGQKLPSSTNTTTKKTLSIFKDEPAPVLNKREEKIAIATEFLYDENGEEYSLEEVLAKSRNLLDIKYPRNAKLEISETPLNDEHEPSVPRSPTMTFHTKAATDEIYEMFNQSLKADSDGESSNAYSDDDEEEEEEDNIDQDDDYSHYKGNEYGKVEGYVESSNNISRNQLDILSTPRNQNGYKSKLPAMTPIAEATEVTNSFNNIINPVHNSVRMALWPKIEQMFDNNLYVKINSKNGKSNSFKKALKLIKSGDKSSKMESNLVLQFPGVDDMFCLKRILGEGAFGSVYLAENGVGDLKAIKVEPTVLPWEFYTVLAAKQRLQTNRDFNSIIGVNSLYAFDDEQYMVLEYASQGTVLDLVNMANSMNENPGLEEIVAMFFAVELLRVVQSLHSVGIIHGDIKPDNIMVRLSEDEDFDKYFQRDGSNNWNKKGITLVDFGRSIDTTLFPVNTQYTADWDIDSELDCIEMTNNLPWTYQTDYHGLAGVIHLLLFGKFLKTHKEIINGETIVKLSTPLKRYWQKDLWNQLFESLLMSSLLSSKTNQPLPINNHLDKIRNEFEQYLEQKCESQGISLKTSLIRIQQELREKKRRF